MRRALIAILIVTAVVIGGGFIATTAYQAGLAANIAVAAPTGTDGTVVAPVVVPGYGYGWGWGPGWGGPGFSIIGFLGTLFVILLIIGLIRALTFRGRWGGGPGRWGPGGPGGPGRWGDHDHEGGAHPWESRARDRFESWHREAHGESPGGSPGESPSQPATPTAPSAPSA